MRSSRAHHVPPGAERAGARTQAQRDPCEGDRTTRGACSDLPPASRAESATPTPACSPRWQSPRGSASGAACMWSSTRRTQERSRSAPSGPLGKCCRWRFASRATALWSTNAGWDAMHGNRRASVARQKPCATWSCDVLETTPMCEITGETRLAVTTVEDFRSTPRRFAVGWPPPSC